MLAVESVNKTKRCLTMEITIEALENGATRVILVGRMDISGSQVADPKFKEIVESHKSLIVDMRYVDFLASLGMRTLVMTAKALSLKGGKMILCAPQAGVEKALRTAGIDTIIPIVNDDEAALAFFK
jgi:anti-sigma B factor antagonist